MPQDIQQIELKLAKEIETLLSLKAGAVQADTPLNTLGLDSLRFVSLLITVEKVFGVNLMKGGIKGKSAAAGGALLARRCCDKKAGSFPLPYSRSRRYLTGID